MLLTSVGEKIASPFRRDGFEAAACPGLPITTPASNILFRLTTQKMPPRRKGKGAARAASTPIADDDAMVIDSPAAETPKSIEEPPKRNDAMLDDPWTDEQETSLFKGLMKWKPNGRSDRYIKEIKMLMDRRCTQAFPNDLVIRTPSKSWLRSTRHKAYTYSRNLGEATDSLQHGYH